MRKILLGTTAVIGAALLAPVANAQEAPTVRIGGYFQFYYGYTQQSNTVANNVVFSQPANVQVGNVTSTQVPQESRGSARAGKTDFASDAEVHVFVNGKMANGLTYGAVFEIAFDVSEGTGTAGGRRNVYSKNSAFLDEAYGFIASPRFGQLRFGDEDGVLGGLMNVGYVTAAGTGGVYGFWQNFTIRPNRTTTSPGDLGDNTKVIYLSPQYFGFDFGVSFAPNSGIGQDNGCIQSYTTFSCDRAYAYTGATSQAIQSVDGQPQRRNENQATVRWRGELAGIGLAAGFGHIGWTPILDATVTGRTVKTLRDGNVWQAGVQASAYGFTAGLNYMWGQYNFFWGSETKGSHKQAEQLFGGLAYTLGPVTVGGNAFMGHYEGTAGYGFGTTTGSLTQSCSSSTTSCRAQQRYAYSVGANYRLAPGLDLIAEYVRHAIHQPGVNVAGGASGSSQDRLRTDVFIVGTRLAF